MADLNVQRSDGVLIHGAFIGSNLQDHGVQPIVDMLALGLTSLIDSTLSDNNGVDGPVQSMRE